MKVVVVGASGLLGAHLLAEGLNRGYEMVGVARHFPQRSGAHQLRDRLRLITADVADVPPGDIADADLLINAAALVSTEAEDLVAKNLTLLEKVVALFEKAKVKRFVHVSSVATLSDGTPGKIVNESHYGQYRDTSYAQAKFLCDQSLADKLGAILSVHPCYMLGRWDAKPSSGAILLALKLKKIRSYLPGQKNFVHAGDVARGLYQAQSAGATGRFVLGGENLGVGDFLAECLRQIGSNEILPEMTKDEALDSPLAREFFFSNAVDDSRAREAFGYAPGMSIRNAIAETVGYFRDHHLLPKEKRV
jgi:dihydroflavonol-4-reductase